MKEMVFQQKLLRKAYFIVKITAPAMIWPVSSNKWKAPICLRGILLARLRRKIERKGREQNKQALFPFRISYEYFVEVKITAFQQY